MQDLLFYFSIIAAIAVAIGETLVLVRTNKYLPLSIDDYFVCAGVLVGALLLPDMSGLLMLFFSWSFMAGNVYAMLFTRMDPITGTRERLGLLLAMLVTSIVGIILTAFTLLNTGV